jgi:hypothetical protein
VPCGEAGWCQGRNSGPADVRLWHLYSTLSASTGLSDAACRAGK